MDSFEVPTTAEDLWQPGHATDDEKEANPTDQDKFLTGSKAIDDTFEGGLDYGKVHCITAKAEHGARELSRALLATHLLHCPEATATIIDSTLTFDVRRLHATLRSSLHPGQSDAMEALKRLKISKVFDRIGMMEAVAELGEELNAEKQQKQQRPAEMTKLRKSTIEDSEDEEDILDESPEKSPSHPGAPVPSTTIKRLLIVDSISHVMTPIIKNDYTQGQALLTSLLRSITEVTQQYNLCTIVLGEAGFKLVSEDETLSRFKSCRIKPAVGYGLGYLVDVHFYLHQLPSRTVTQGTTERQVRQEPIHVLEIVEERDGNRQWSWAAFRFTEEGTLEEVKA
ncbi:hypothetical protein CB0940_01044 [Cercospora beticola]|uniref:DNA recombination and repair protein Rad51-like C-terminal domain-containing protein n=1 Tax=Cercospora beticola TaxID=122368 RepID=A0A2G5IC10_CERBT|nr:hypothetical protein CB0940_01044 [Cercospora beticola]PIB02386.1 hypothetical protein CB0940_01044 [Cercospora beticola]WPA96469.1 hypothetical protein RHO25_001076 [Cercospora beticola]CAK1355201.1 unnamed protein product [Cercospora beticola]